jgi:hypothetical protein
VQGERRAGFADRDRDAGQFVPIAAKSINA